ncbi:Cleft lip and palate transmembrane protein 1, partial [Araneus ventricosus]
NHREEEFSLIIFSLGRMSNANTPPQTQEDDGQTSPSPPAAKRHAGNFWSVLRKIMLSAFILYFVRSFFGEAQKPTENIASNGSMPTKISQNLFQNGTKMTLYVYISAKPELTFNAMGLIWFQPNIVYGDECGGPNGDGTYTLETEIETFENSQKNSSIWLHVCVTKKGDYPAASIKGRPVWPNGICKSKRMNKYKKLQYQRTHNLLTGETAASAEDIKKAEESHLEYISYWHPNITINIINDDTAWVQGHVPPPVVEFVEFDHASGDYLPILYISDDWNLMREYYPINETVKSLPIHLTFQQLSLFRWQLDTIFRRRTRTSILDQDLDEFDEVQDYMKEAVLERSPILIGLTFVVSVVHSIFEFLAFKNDIQFWNNRKSLYGLSVLSVFFNLFQSIVVLLYVLDDDTEMVVRMAVFVGLQIWKICKITNFKINKEERRLGTMFEINLKGSYAESSTKQFDTMAFKYLSWVLFPLLGCYAVYSLLYLEHTGWYSWVLSMVHEFLLTFGFIMVTPQLFINYKLKSVAHLPWRMLFYKFLNAFIENFVAFVNKMPTMVRLYYFSNGIVFFVYLYQRWIYHVDPKRIN